MSNQQPLVPPPVPCKHADLFTQIVAKLDALDSKLDALLNLYSEEDKEEHSHDDDGLDEPAEDPLDNLTNTLVESILANPLLNVSVLPDDLERQLYTVIFDILKQYA